MVELRTLGVLDLRLADGTAIQSVLQQPKRTALLVYLAMSPTGGFQRRDTLVALFWPDSSEASARHSLSQAVYKLRQALGSDAILTRGDEEVGLAAGVVRCDATSFLSAAKDNRYADALDLYVGDFLTGLHLAEAVEFDRWVEAQRAALRHVAARAAWSFARDQLRRRVVIEAERSARRAFDLDPGDEASARGFLRELAHAGELSAASVFYEHVKSVLALEFGLEPPTEMRAVLESARQRARVRLQDKVAPLAPPSPVASRWSRLRSPRTAAAVVGILAIAAATVVLLRDIAATEKLPATERKRLTFTGFVTRGALSPDGQFLAYLVEGLEDSSRVIVQDLTGGPPDSILAFIPAGSIERTIEWSPNGARLLVKIPGKVLLLHRRGGRPEIVRSFRPEDQPHWLPDGSRISLSNLRTGRLLLLNPDNGDSLAIRIPPVSSNSTDGSWSRDLRFAVATWTPDSARWMIRSITADGRMETLLEDSLPLNSPRWSPDGKVLYYLRGRDAIWRVNVSRRTGRITGDPEKVESGIDALPGTVPPQPVFRAMPIAHFSLSGDGHKLVFAKGDEFSNIFRVDPINSTTPPRMQPLTTGTAYRWSPVVSPNGQWIAFAAQTKDGAELFRMPFAGGPAVAITRGARVQVGSEIAWSPGGGSIAFQSVRAGRSRLWIATVTTGELRSFSQTNTTIIIAHLTWAPGSRIAYKTPRYFIRTLDPATGTDELLVRDTADAFFNSPRYSPGGREIAMTRWRAPEKDRPANVSYPPTQTSILRIRDGAERRLPTGQVFPRAWSADGRFLFVQDGFKSTVLRIDPHGQKPPDTVFTAPVRGMECVPEPVLNRSFICGVSDFHSDIWMIENFDRR